MNKEEVISYIKNHFPSTPTEEVAKHLNISPYQVRSLAKNYNITKSEAYLNQLKTNLKVYRRKWYENNIPPFQPTYDQEQIIFGSLLGDGYISKGGKRSENYYYREHFGEGQRAYREWKQGKLNNLRFTIHGNFLQSPSHPYFTELYKQLYNSTGEKILTKKFLSRCTHPFFLATLYLDDGSLVLSYTYNESNHTVYCHPSIILYTLNFSKEENQLLANHLNQTFRTNFVVSRHPDGKGHLLKLNKQKEVQHLINVIKPFAKDVPLMAYKTDIQEKLRSKSESIRKKYGETVNIMMSSSDRKKNYTCQEINTIIKLCQAGYTQKEIAKQLGRTYWSVVYKIRDLRERGLI